jgi:hypothetical protein
MVVVQAENNYVWVTTEHQWEREKQKPEAHPGGPPLIPCIEINGELVPDP